MKKEKCEICGGEGVVTLRPGEDDEKEVVCPECYEEEDFSGATEGDR